MKTTAGIHSQARLPAEWEPHAGIQLTWPDPCGDWRENFADAEACFVAIARAVSGRETLLVAASDKSRVSARLAAAGIEPNRVRLYEAPSNDSWARDHGALTVFEGDQAVLLDFTFNGWGNKYPFELDNALNATLHREGAFGKTPMRRVELVLEGGAIETDGRGTLLATARSIFAPTRNPSLGRSEIEGLLRHHLGIRRFLWLEHGRIPGDDTDGHVDTLARFCDSRTIAYVACRDERHAAFAELKQMESELKTFCNAQGKPYRLVALPLPRQLSDKSGAALPATYANFLILNGAVLVPTYADPADEEAVNVIGSCFPGRAVVPIDCRALILQHGSLHCVTMHFPMGVEL